MQIVTAGNPWHVRHVVGAVILAAWALTGCAARTGPRPMIAEAPPASNPAVISETPTTEQAQTAPTTTTTAEVPPSEVHSTTLPVTEPATTEASTAPTSTTETSNGEEFLPKGTLIQAEGPPRPSVDYSLSGTYLYGNVRGFAQISEGGKLGTSNSERPQFHSIGINTANIADFELSADAHQYGDFFVGAQIIQLSGEAYIGNKTLTTAGITYPANSHVSSDIGLNWYRFGYRYMIPIHTLDNGVPDITFTPYAEGLIWAFDYNLTVPHARTAHREFDEGGVQIGAGFGWRPNGGPLTLEATLGSFPQADHIVNISVESLDLRYNFYDYQRFSFSGVLGVTWEQQDFHDSQTLPNHVSVNFGPMLTAGLQVKF